MAEDEQEKVKELLSDFDYRYAKKYLYNLTDNPDMYARAYVDRNPGLATRRNEEYTMYSEKKYIGE